MDTFSEMQQYLEESFKDQTFTKSFSYKYSEFLSLGSVLAAVILFVVLLSRDMKKDIYALLHTKPFMGSKYVLCKLISGASVIYMAIILLIIRGISRAGEVIAALEPNVALLAGIFLADNYYKEFSNGNIQVFYRYPLQKKMSAVLRRNMIGSIT